MTIVISVENLSKVYRLGQIGTGTFSRDLELWLAKIRGKPNPFLKIGQVDHDNREGEELWALRDVSFNVEQGEALGIIGRNGAGKSTLLKIISRVTAPSLGKIKVKGRVACLLEVGTGFHPELTGRENIYLNGSILGMSRREIDRKFDEIVQFSGVDKFVDTPVKRYSSGMYVRLAFAVAAHLDPEILVVDEVLAVGDAEFQKKCLGKMSEVAQGGRTVLFVSHNMGAIRSLCRNSILLEEGYLRERDISANVIDHYLSTSAFDLDKTGSIVFKEDPQDINEIKLLEIKMLDSNNKIKTVFNVEQPIMVEIMYKVMKPITGMRVNIHLLTDNGVTVFTTTDHSMRPSKTNPGNYKSVCRIPGGLLNLGLYRIKIGMDNPGVKVLIEEKEYFQFQTIGISSHGSTFPGKWPGVISPYLHWDIYCENIEINKNEHL
jgi:lipopolysaccharide transport system ATP-binding protein